MERLCKLDSSRSSLGVWAKVPCVTEASVWAVSMTAGINSNVDVCEEAKHHTELFWYKLYKFIFLAANEKKTSSPHTSLCR